jgi:hypothetical protein
VKVLRNEAIEHDADGGLTFRVVFEVPETDPRFAEALRRFPDGWCNGYARSRLVEVANDYVAQRPVIPPGDPRQSLPT